MTTVGDPENFGELLRGARRHHDVTKKEFVEWSWSWKFTFSAAPQPEHVELCGRRYLADEILGGGGAFVNAVASALQPFVTHMWTSGRSADAEALMRVYIEDSTAPYSGAGMELAQLESQIDDGCRQLDVLWIHATDPGEIEYNNAVEKQRTDIAAFTRHREDVIEQLASIAEATADRVRTEDAAAAEKVDRLCEQLRRDGVETFVR